VRFRLRDGADLTGKLVHRKTSSRSPVRPLRSTLSCSPPRSSGSSTTSSTPSAPAAPPDRRRTAPRAPRPSSQASVTATATRQAGIYMSAAIMCGRASQREVKHHRVVHIEMRDDASKRPYR